MPSAATLPIISGNAPGIAPIATAAVETRFIGVYTKEYSTIDNIPNKPAQALKIDKQNVPAIHIKPAANTASDTDILPAAKGRFSVRFIILSKSLSSTWFNAFAAPVTKKPPIPKSKIPTHDGVPSKAIR